MKRKIFTFSNAIAATIALCALAVVSSAQNSNTSKTTTTTTTRTTKTTRKPATPTPTPNAAQDETTTATTQDSSTHTRTRRTGASTGASNGASEPGAAAVRAVFDTLVRNIERSDVEAVMALYWNSPQLTIFNNNGTVTRGWEQVHANRASSYPDAKNVKIDARNVKVQMLGATGAVVTCLWHQSQDFRGQSESSTGRLTVVFRVINNGWKIVHTHSSPESPDPSRLAPSDQVVPPPARTVATPPPARP